MAQHHPAAKIAIEVVFQLRQQFSRANAIPDLD
jgi:hypothetical protein